MSAHDSSPNERASADTTLLGKPPAGAAEAVDTPAALDQTSPQLTWRALLTGMVLGGLLSVCNVYAGLRVGFVFDVSITAVLLSYAFWTPLHHLSGRRWPQWGLLENNINQTAASAGASVAAAGLVAPIPALIIMTKQTLHWPVLSLWVFSVCLVGIVVAVGLRRQMLLHQKLRFPSGVAFAATLRQMYARGTEAVARVLGLVLSALVAGGVAVFNFACSAGVLPLPGRAFGSNLAQLTFGIRPEPLFAAIGGLIGLRICFSMLVGSLIAFIGITPHLVRSGTIPGPQFGHAVNWLVWPGATLMVVAALTSFAWSWRSWWTAATALRPGGPRPVDPGAAEEVSRLTFLVALGVTLLLSVMLQVALFRIIWWAAIVSVLLSFLLALVAARVAGETGINPVAAIGKVTQLLLGVLAPQNPAANLMGANVTGGAASQCAALLADLKCGYLLGASPRRQALAQVCGAAAGAVVGSLTFALLVPDPARNLFTEEFPAPGARVSLMVAELFKDGWQALPAGTPLAMLLAAVAAIGLTLPEKLLPPQWQRWTLSPASLGLAFVFPASVSLTIFLGGVTAYLVAWRFPAWSARNLITVCAGIVVGDTLTGVGTKIQQLLAAG